MNAYLNLLSHVMNTGKDRSDRTGTGTRSVFGYQFRHSMADGFPLLTTKQIHIKSIIHELLWFLRGETNVKSLQEAGVTIWNEWADENGELGPVYGEQWRRWKHYVSMATVGAFQRGPDIDQIAGLMQSLSTNPDSRRHIVTAWNPADVPKMKLPPCHTLWQCYVDGKVLHLHLYARSIDSFLGLPFNIASYAFLLHTIAHVQGLIAGDLIISFGDLHIYKNHFVQVRQQLARMPRKLPSLSFSRVVTDIDDFRFEDFVIEDYNPHPAIKAPVAV